MNFDFDKPTERLGTNSVKFDGLKEYFGKADLLPMWVADMDFQAPAEIINAIKDRADHGVFGYTLVSHGFNESIKMWMKKRHGWDISSKWILFCPGIVPALAMSVMAYTDPGDRILLQSPVYPPFFSVIKDNKRQMVNNQLIEEKGRYTIDFDDLDKKLSNKVKMMFFCNPHNPAGRVWSKEEVEKVIELCRKYNVILISDEIHSDLIYPRHTHIPAALDQDSTDNLVICMAPSKTFNLAGLSSAFMIIPDSKLRRKMKTLIENLHINHGNIFGLIALQVAYEKGEEWLEALMKYLLLNRNTVTEFCNSELPGITAVAAEGTYLIWLDCRGTGMDDRALKKFFIRDAGIATNPGPVFGPGGEGFHRLNIGCPNATLIKALNKIKTALKKR
ncbi:MAG: MalY/PatB family protein [Bacteroidales bacterium]